jgi:hypothetical protein
MAVPWSGINPLARTPNDTEARELFYTVLTRLDGATLRAVSLVPSRHTSYLRLKCLWDESWQLTCMYTYTRGRTGKSEALEPPSMRTKELGTNLEFNSNGLPNMRSLVKMPNVPTQD